MASMTKRLLVVRARRLVPEAIGPAAIRGRRRPASSPCCPGSSTLTFREHRALAHWPGRWSPRPAVGPVLDQQVIEPSEQRGAADEALVALPLDVVLDALARIRVAEWASRNDKSRGPFLQ
jgi:hypothetical protein